ncbi:MAG: tail fiber domain-containing protein [Sphingomonadales bacterium]|nr:tail fiber domain-containing protein [Sphingomonadales bacterium]MBK6493023.1 tail fiber domain-containing protein [Sphingomonadales bacterium]MBK6720110.1 tail fiber domain-containing protein [Sphingomonadales bacterium]MBL0001755.1 tail fiber domain-containing protein [Sphingomonadales bacterium]MBL0115892.1 tail fiber domain-containing protein [Sphingomonadales bacterium]
MPSTILLKRSSTASIVPAAASLQAGELAVNLADQKLYSKTTGGTVVQVGFGNLTSAMVTTALGFTPYNSTNPSGYITASGSITGSSGSCTGNAATATRWATGRTIALTGDVSGTSAAFDGSAALSFATTLANSGVTAGTYLKVTVDAKGRVTAGSSMTSGDVTSALGYTPANKAGDSFTGNISVSGSVTATGDITAYSDARLKADVETITGALDRVRKLRGVTFSRRETGNRGVGLIAQELAPIVPEAVMTHEDGLLSVAYGNLVGVLIEAVKDLADKVERLEAQP